MGVGWLRVKGGLPEFNPLLIRGVQCRRMIEKKGNVAEII